MQYNILGEGHIKNPENKIGRPSIFIGSSVESIPIAEEIKKLMPKEIYEVDAWYDGIFGPTKDTDNLNGLSNMEWLSTFTDIYDFAIFIFVPDDAIKSKTRLTNSGKLKSASAIRHNVIFEFGLFMGKIGVKKCFILYDKEVNSFIKDFFTDLKENVNDLNIETKDNFSLEVHQYEGQYLQYIKKYKGDIKQYFIDKTVPPFKEQSLHLAIHSIKDKIDSTYQEVDISFLPATTLAIGFYKNFLKVFIKNLNLILSKQHPDNWKKQNFDQSVFERVLKAPKIEFRIVIPTSLEGALQDNFTAEFDRNDFDSIFFPGETRAINFLCSSTYNEGDDFIGYDIPTTLNASIDAINMMTNKKDIIELLKEKEIRNFTKALDLMIEQDTYEYKMLKPRQVIKVISIGEFRKIAPSIKK